MGQNKKGNEIPYEIDSNPQYDYQLLKTLANNFNNYFLDTSKTIKKTHDRDKALSFIVSDVEGKDVVLQFKKINITDMWKIVYSLKNTMASGWDEIPLFVIKYVMDLIQTPLCNLINQSLEKRVFPQKLKYYEIKPLYKKMKSIVYRITASCITSMFLKNIWKSSWASVEKLYRKQ